MIHPMATPHGDLAALRGELADDLPGSGCLAGARTPGGVLGSAGCGRAAATTYAFLKLCTPMLGCTRLADGLGPLAGPLRELDEIRIGVGITPTVFNPDSRLTVGI